MKKADPRNDVRVRDLRFRLVICGLGFQGIVMWFVCVERGPGFSLSRFDQIGFPIKRQLPISPVTECLHQMASFLFPRKNKMAVASQKEKKKRKKNPNSEELAPCWLSPFQG